MFDPDTMRKRFHELGAQRETIIKEAAPLRAKREALVAAHEAEVRPLEKTLRAIETGLYEIDQERAVIARALNGKTGAA